MPRRRDQTVLSVAAALGQELQQLTSGRRERSAGPFHLSLWRQDGQRRLVIAHRDRHPSYEELQAISQAAGAPEDCEPLRTVCMMTSQDGSYRRLPAYVIAWREV
jgi:hypothetical protein